MAQQTVISNTTQPLGIPNTGTGTDQGDTWDAAIAKINANFTEVYGGGAIIAGTGTATYKAAGNVSVTAGAPLGSSATNVSQTMVSYSLPGGSLSAVGKGLEVTAWGKFGTTGTPGVAMVIGGAIGSIATGSHTSLVWELNAMTLKQTANAQNNFFTTVLSGSAAITNVTDTSTDGSAITIAIVANDANAVQSSVLLFGFTVEYFG